MRRTAFVMVLFAGTVAFAQPAAEPCGGVELKGGKVILVRPLAPADVDKPDGKACVAHVAKRLMERKGMLSVTANVRVPDKQRLEGKAVAAAKKVKDLLIASGVPAQRASSVAPRAEADETPSVVFTYQERRERPIGRLDVVQGKVFAGTDAAAPQAAKKGQLLTADTFVRCDDASNATLMLADGSVVRLSPGSAVKLVSLEMNEQQQRLGKLAVGQGDVVVSVAPSAKGSHMEVAVLGASLDLEAGTLRVTVENDGAARIEQLKGTAKVGKKTKLEAGKATRVGGKNGAVTTMAAAPRPLAPLQGKPKERVLKWSAVEGSESYVVEIARDADFSRDIQTMRATSAEQVFDKLGKGQWFWRVSGIDKDGFVGMPSKIYSFTI